MLPPSARYRGPNAAATGCAWLIIAVTATVMTLVALVVVAWLVRHM